MTDNLIEQQANETPLLELARNVPKDLRAEWEIQWMEDGTPCGHAMAPVGKYIHDLADALAAKDADHKKAELEWWDEKGVLEDQISEQAAEIKRLKELNKNDAKEIGSYRDKTGLRGEWIKQNNIISERDEHILNLAYELGTVQEQLNDLYDVIDRNLERINDSDLRQVFVSALNKCEYK